ncbi:MAG TPA: HAD family hydrolase [Gaiellaceae bacterium]|nr:HAD family hydrolase [Gaiellaceae bacterium]
MLEAVLFDWSNTLVGFDWDDELVAAGHRAALGRDDPEFTARWRGLVLGEAHGFRPYVELLEELGVADPDAFVDAEHEAWRPAHAVLAAARALLESLRSRGLRTGVAANSWPEPARVLHADAEAFGLAALVDAFVTSDEVGAMKPAPELFLAACERLGVEPAAAMFVGDSLVRDVQGAANVGMTTVQAMWFRADDSIVPVEPDFRAFTPMDVLNFARRLA